MIRLLLAIALLLPLAARGQAAQLFPTSDRCMACHNGLLTPAGQDASIGVDWRSSMMANASRDPYWQAAVRREVLDHPEAAAAIEDECSKCHMPMAQRAAALGGGKGELLAHLPIGARDDEAHRLAADGVSCGTCHQIQPEGLGTKESFNGGFVIDTETPWGQREAFGPFEIQPGHAEIMRSASAFRPVQAEHIQSAELCATCHTLYTHPLGPEGEVPGLFPEQVPYLEWQHSSFGGAQPCQGCHMPTLEEPVPISSVLGEPRSPVARHVFRGGNAFMQRLLNRFGSQLGVEALPSEFTAAAERTAAHLSSEAAQLEVSASLPDPGSLIAEVRVENLAGHKLPTAYPSRRAWLHVTVRDAASRIVFESGKLQQDGAIEGNDNDADPARYEPHHERITDPAQVQIYEPILGGPAGQVTTGLLTATQYLKDNRLLPDGFDKASAGADFAVYGRAGEDPDFQDGGDRIRYEVKLVEARPPYRVEVELLYQPIGHRWAHNLAPYDAPEPRRFVRFYEAMSAGSALRLAEASASAQ